MYESLLRFERSPQVVGRNQRQDFDIVRFSHRWRRMQPETEHLSHQTFGSCQGMGIPRLAVELGFSPLLFSVCVCVCLFWLFLCYLLFCVFVLFVFGSVLLF